MNFDYYYKHINKKTKGRYDVTPLFSDQTIFSNLIKDMCKPFNKTEYDIVAGLDALGFVIGGAISQKQKKGFLAIRKGGKLPGIRGTVVREYFVDYTGTRKSLEIGKGSIKKGDRILLADEWIETGAQMKSAVKLIEKLGGVVVGITALAAHKNKKSKVLFDKYNLEAIKVINEL